MWIISMCLWANQLSVDCLKLTYVHKGQLLEPSAYKILLWKISQTHTIGLVFKTVCKIIYYNSKQTTPT